MSDNLQVTKASFGDRKHKVKSFMIISAQDNPEKRQKFLWSCQKCLLQPIEIGGRFILINISLDEAKYKAERLGQKRFFYCESLWNDDCKTGGFVICLYRRKKYSEPFKLHKRSRRIESEKDFDGFFSECKLTGFSVYETLFKEKYDGLKDITNYQSLKEVFKPNKTGKYYIICRAGAYHDKSQLNNQKDIMED